MNTNVIDAIANNDICIGCGICAGICPQGALIMKFNKYGEYVPYQEKECPEKCGFCLNVCPFYEKATNENVLGEELFSGIDNSKYLPDVGYYLESYVGYSYRFRESGASGGMTTWLLTTLLEKNVVDYVICVTPHNKSNKLFVFEIFDNASSVSSSSGSAYYPVEMSKVIKKILDEPGRYAVTGLPCFLKGLKLASKKNRILDERIAVTIGLVCGQMKSKHYTTYLSTLAHANGKLQNAYYRGKNPDNPANNYYFHCTNEEGAKGKIYWDEGVSEAWVNRWFTQNACNFCDDIFAELADITFMDAWLKEYSYDSRGNNLLIVRSKSLQNLIFDGIKSGQINVSEILINKLIESQKGVIDLKRDQLQYRLYLSDKYGLKIPIKRVKAANNIDFFKRKEVELKNKMQIMSKKYFVDNFDGEYLHLSEFRRQMKLYIYILYSWKLVQKYIAIPKQIRNKYS
ncbi:Coenzyme F420 hydrogenase/dehydrogenase, beta subunit C-terminal domain [Methanococcoides seepicolus]|uniref:Coenzyme F420 hydrogenase/dehydrogenase, beta subunit C-terminal domain n=1 Tax=Methanococcoides seepicolus TaxID=2828780 RepID=A0A9E4ZF22_9EURY|nr:Coenzyme F420 hydrogenase/dehydrogenase, beta subunit C-terminal domain [Methanococcoides seepicolus]MCM1986700.1 Coenzyme F420 hydrogenase/dehydrogenase, beta subunit C-terminal domain [Methanococcoides seepicolus]